MNELIDRLVAKVGNDQAAAETMGAILGAAREPFRSRRDRIGADRFDTGISSLSQVA